MSLGDPYATSPEMARALWDAHDAAANLMVFRAKACAAEAARLREPKNRKHQDTERTAKAHEAECWRELGQRLDIVEGLRRTQEAARLTIGAPPCE